MPSDEERLLVRLEATLTKFERQLARAQQVTNTTATGIENRFKRANTQIGTTADRAATGIMRITQVSGAGRFVLQNTANQLGDIAVQMQGGANASRVLGQQLPQLLGGFGALGGSLGILAPLLGTVAAIGLPLAGVFFAMARDSAEAAEEAKTLAETVDALAKATKDYQSAAETSSQSIVDLRQKYGDLADEVQRALDVQTALRRGEAESALRSVGNKTAGAFGGLGQAQVIEDRTAALVMTIDTLQRLDAEFLTATGARVGEISDQIAGLEADLQRMQAFRRELEAVARQYGITTEQAGELAAAAARLNEAADPAAQVAAAEALRNILVEVFGSAQKANEATGGLVQQLSEAVVAGADLVVTTEGLAPNIGAGADQAARLAENIRQAANAQRQLDQMAFEFSPGGQALEAFGSRAPGGTTAQNALASRMAPKPVRRGGGGSSNINAQEAADLAKVKRLYDETRTSAEQYAIELEELNRLKETGAIDSDLYARSVEQLGDKFGEVASRANSMQSAFESAFVSIITGSDSARGALSKLFAQLASSLARQAFSSIWKNTGLSDWFSFDGGGYTGMGSRTGGVDGKGGFPAILHPNETVIDHTKGQSMGGGVVISIDARGAVEGVAGQVRREVEAMLPQITAASRSSSVDLRSRGKQA